MVWTAAHNVYNEQKPIRKRYPYIRFIPGANEHYAPFGEIEVEDISAPNEYTNHKAGENDINAYDYALLILKKPIGKETGYFGLHAIAEEYAILLEEKKVYLAGYGYPEFEMKDEEEKNKSSGFELWK